MAFVANDNQQLTLTDSTLNLTQREKRVLEKSWAKTINEKKKNKKSPFTAGGDFLCYID